MQMLFRAGSIHPSALLHVLSSCCVHWAIIHLPALAQCFTPGFDFGPNEQTGDHFMLSSSPETDNPGPRSHEISVGIAHGMAWEAGGQTGLFTGTAPQPGLQLCHHSLLSHQRRLQPLILCSLLLPLSSCLA